MACTTVDLIGHALLAGTLHVRDLDFPTDKVICLSVSLIPAGSSDAGCVLYRDGFRSPEGHGVSIKRITAIAPLFATSASEPFACRDVSEMAGLSDRLLDLVAKRALSDADPQHYHVAEHWMGSRGDSRPPRHDTLTAARTEMSTRAERYRRDCKVEGNPLVGYVISVGGRSGVLQIVPCRGTTC